MKMTLHIKKSSTICKSQHKNDSSEFKIILNLKKVYSLKLKMFAIQKTVLENEKISHHPGENIYKSYN